MRTLTWTASLVVLALLAGCGKSPSAASPPASGSSAALAGAAPTAAPASLPAAATDVCALLTKAEVEAATGVKVGEVLATKTDNGKPKCEYRHADASFGTAPVATVALSAKVETDKNTWSKLMQTTPVEGIGDYAYLYTLLGPSLFTGRNGKAILVSLYDGGPPEKRQGEIKTLASQAVGRL